ncbi:unnamed protein product [Closterium sp. NIES-53]
MEYEQNPISVYCCCLVMNDALVTLLPPPHHTTPHPVLSPVSAFPLVSFLLTNPTSMGYEQNPISVYYCYRACSSSTTGTATANTNGSTSKSEGGQCEKALLPPADSLAVCIGEVRCGALHCSYHTNPCCYLPPQTPPFSHPGVPSLPLLSHPPPPLSLAPRTMPPCVFPASNTPQGDQPSALLCRSYSPRQPELYPPFRPPVLPFPLTTTTMPPHPSSQPFMIPAPLLPDPFLFFSVSQQCNPLTPHQHSWTDRVTFLFASPSLALLPNPSPLLALPAFPIPPTPHRHTRCPTPPGLTESTSSSPHHHPLLSSPTLSGPLPHFLPTPQPPPRQVSNTPWTDRVTFLFAPLLDHVPKPLHVSPFMDMQSTWVMRALPPSHCISLHITALHPVLGCREAAAAQESHKETEKEAETGGAGSGGEDALETKGSGSSSNISNSNGGNSMGSSIFVACLDIDCLPAAQQPYLFPLTLPTLPTLPRPLTPSQSHPHPPSSAHPPSLHGLVAEWSREVRCRWWLCCMPHRVAFWIYWQAFLLWWKGVPLFEHPKYTEGPAYAESTLHHRLLLLVLKKRKLVIQVTVTSCRESSGRMTRPRLLSVVLGILSVATIAAAYRSTQAPLRIDCGSDSPTSANGLEWQGDKYSNGGESHTIASANSFSLNTVESTLRAFAVGTTGCYNIPVIEGRYLVRVSFAYYNYDDKNMPPYFSVLVQNTVVESVDMTVVQSNFVSGAYYSDYIAYALNGKLSVCFQAQPGSPGPAIVNSLEVLPQDTDAYDAATLGNKVILSTYVRLNMGGGKVGPEPADPGFRTWMEDVRPEQGNFTVLTKDSASAPIAGTGVAPDYLPPAVFETSRAALTPLSNTSGVAGRPSQMSQATGFRMTVLPVDKNNMWYIRFYFVELDPSAQPGDRVFEILLGSGNVVKSIGNQAGGFDIRAKVAPLTALVVPVFFNYSQYSSNYGEDLEVGVRTVGGSRLPAVISGVELFEVVPQTTTESSGLSGAAIAAIVIGCLFVVVLIVLGVVLIMRRRRAGGAGFSQISEH